MNSFSNSLKQFVLIISSISSFDIINTILCEAEDEGQFPEPNIFLYIPASAADAASVNLKGINTLLADSLITFFINGSPVYSNGPNSLLRNLLIVSFLIIEFLII